MTTLSDKIDNMTIRVTSPDGNIMAKLHNLYSVRISFRPGSYPSYDADGLTSQLAALLTTVWETRRTTVRDLFADDGGLEPLREPHWDANRRRFREGLRNLRLRGASIGGLVKVRSTGMASFECRIKPGSLDSLTENQFVAEFNTALRALEADRRHQTAKLKDQHFDMGRDGGVTIAIPSRPA